MNKNKEIKIRLSEDELELLEINAAKVGYNKSQYIRSLIKGITPKTKTELHYYKLIDEFNEIASALQEIRINNKYYDNKIDVEDVISALDALIKKVDQQLRVPNK